MPEVIETSYLWSFKELAKIALAFDSWSEEQTPAIACSMYRAGKRAADICKGVLRDV